MRWTRREWLITVSAGLAAMACGQDPGEPGPIAVAPPAACPFALPTSVGLLGRAWLAANPAEGSVATLSQALFGAPQPPAPAEALATLRRLRAADLKAGHLVSAGGWLLPPSEARACALVCLTVACEVPPPAPPTPKRPRKPARKHTRKMPKTRAPAPLGPVRGRRPAATESAPAP